MLHQIKVSKRIKGVILFESTRAIPIILKPRLEIRDVVYWQERVAKLLPDCHVTCQVAKEQ
jgi:hypothetical protein